MRWPRQLFSSPKAVVLGLDISSTAVTLIQLSFLGEQYCVNAYGQQPLDCDDIESTGEAIRCLLTDLNSRWICPAKVCDAVIAVPDACTITRTITVSDRLDDHDLEELVHVELDKFIPHSTEDICFDFKRLGPSSSHAALKELLIVATRVHHVQQRVAALRQGGLRTSVVDIESFAIQRVLPLLVSPEEAKGVTLLLDLGVRCLKVFFFNGMILIYMREEALGTQDHEGLDYGDELVLRIKRCCQFFYSAHAQTEPIAQMILAGSGAKQPALVAFLQDHLDRPMQVANPFTTMTFATGLDVERLIDDAPLYLTACGLAKRGC